MLIFQKVVIFLLAGVAFLNFLPIHLPDHNLKLLISMAFKKISNYEEYLLLYGASLISAHFLIQKKWIKALLAFGIGASWIVLIYPNFISYIDLISVDSILEVGNFNYEEFKFWMENLLSRIFHIDIITLKKRFYLLAFYLAFLFPLYLIWRKFNLKNNDKFLLFLGTLIFLLGLIFNFYDFAYKLSKNGQIEKNIEKNFSEKIPGFSKNSNNLNVLMYIGESTSSMHMGLYGYPRETTPNLEKISKQEGFIKFDEMFSTHSHTLQALLESLSIGKNDDVNLPIYERKRQSLIEILKKSNIKTHLISNQPKTGGWAKFSQVIFQSSESQKYSSDSNKDIVYDHHFFEDSFREVDLNNEEKSLYVFHSYAGHAPYLKNIPKEFSNNVDTFFKSTDINNSGAKEYISQVQRYDSSISYIDYSISRALSMIKDIKTPWVFLYYSDHGDAPLVGKAHDSADPYHEMFRIPLILYFNEAARIKYQDLFRKYKLAANKKNTLTLEGLAPTILDIFGIENKLNNLNTFANEPIKSSILLREIKGVYKGVNISAKDSNQNFIDTADGPTKIYRASKFLKAKNKISCYHRSNSTAKAIRGVAVTNCLEMDIVIDNQEVFVYHPPKRTSLTIEKMLNIISKKSGISLWLDSKNLNSYESCLILKNKLDGINNFANRVLVEIQPSSSREIKDMENCLKDMSELYPLDISYYIPRDLAINCSKSIKKGGAFNENGSCKKLEDEINFIHSFKVINQISFDYRWIEAINKLNLDKYYVFNTWGVHPDKIKDLKNLEKFNMIILTTNDLNNL